MFTSCCLLFSQSSFEKIFAEFSALLKGALSPGMVGERTAARSSPQLILRVNGPTTLTFRQHLPQIWEIKITRSTEVTADL